MNAIEALHLFVGLFTLTVGISVVLMFRAADHRATRKATGKCPTPFVFTNPLRWLSRSAGITKLAMEVHLLQIEWRNYQCTALEVVRRYGCLSFHLLRVTKDRYSPLDGLPYAHWIWRGFGFVYYAYTPIQSVMVDLFVLGRQFIIKRRLPPQTDETPF